MMDKNLMETLFMAAIADAMKNGGQKKPEAEKTTDCKDETTEIALINKMLFDAHLKVGFTAEQAMQIVVAINTCDK